MLGPRHGLNPGSFNYRVDFIPSNHIVVRADEYQKENVLIYILANLSFLTRLSADVLTEQRIFYGLEAGWGFEILITLATILYGFGLAGLDRFLIVEPRGWSGLVFLEALLSTRRCIPLKGKSWQSKPTFEVRDGTGLTGMQDYLGGRLLLTSSS